ncbi:MAG: type I DNA topoisomerase [Clostridiales bacterium]|nr:type I DNA topoisomerase [Clostridiales bacterium]
MKNLVIVESPSKAKTIQKYLGNDYQVLASSGHICDLPERSLGIDIERNFEPQYEISKDKKKRAIIKKLKEAVKESSDVYLAADPDREGEAISWHLSKVLELGENAKRIVFNEISAKAIKNALNSPKSININLVEAQQARRVIDRLVGYKISPILNKKIKQGLSGGRVQSAALKMLVDREREIRAFVPEEYWNIHAHLNAGNASVRTLLTDHNGKKIKVNNQESTNEIVQKLNNADKWFVDSVVKGSSKSRPNAPFTTSTLQQDGSTRLMMTAPEVMRIAQQLYEGVDIEGEGHTALVTYIRTDSVRVTEDAQREAINFITTQYGKEYAPSKPNTYTSKGNVQDAHEAIRPISLEITPESIKNKVSRNQYRLYRLIYERFLASQMKDAQYATLKVHITAQVGDEKFGFRVNGRTIIFKGYTIVYESANEEDEVVDDNKLPNLSQGEILQLKEVKYEQKFTKAPPRFTDATLVKAMEENGVGRPSTYASVISTLEKREYTQKEGKTIKPTALGETVTEFMENNFRDIVDISFTADMESKLDQVENGVDWHKVIQDFYPDFLANIKKARMDDKSFKVQEEVTDVICDKCGSNMVIKNGKYGKFLACPMFPDCKNIKSIVEVVGVCPKCKGDVVKKKTKTGRIFYGCGNYPNCDFMSWELPAPYFCPKCSYVMRVVENNGEKKYICVNKNCNHTEIVRAVEKAE